MDICSFPSSHKPMTVRGVSLQECFAAFENAIMPDKYIVTNARLLFTAGNGNKVFQEYLFDLCALDGETGGCIPGTTAKDNKDFLLLTFDEEQKFVGYQDWWEAGTQSRVDKLLEERDAETSSLASTLQTSTLSSMCLLFTSWCLVAAASFQFGKSRGMSSNKETSAPLLQA